MVFLSEEWCEHCGQTTQHHNSQCAECSDRLRREEIAAWNAKTVDERLNNLRQRVERLERRGVDGPRC